MNASSKKSHGPQDRGPESTGERRRLSRVRHDDRGNAYVEWVDAPAELVKRPKLEVQPEPGDRQQLDARHRAFYPYANHAGAERKAGSSRTDLRKLSAWITLKRELEERKRSDPDGGEDPDTGED